MANRGVTNTTASGKPAATLRVIADGLIAWAEELPHGSRAAGLLRDAATSLLDADTALEEEGLE